MRAHIVIIGAGISGLTAAITIGEGVDKLIAAGETIARPEMTLLDAADWIGGRARTDELSTGVSVDAGAHWFHGGARNPFYKWACDRHYDLGPVGIDTAARLQCLGGRRSDARAARMGDEPALRDVCDLEGATSG